MQLAFIDDQRDAGLARRDPLLVPFARLADGDVAPPEACAFFFQSAAEHHDVLGPAVIVQGDGDAALEGDQPDDILARADRQIDGADPGITRRQRTGPRARPITPRSARGRPYGCSSSGTSAMRRR